MNRLGILITVVVLALIGVTLMSMQPDRSSVRRKQRKPTPSQQSKPKPRSSSIGGTSRGEDTSGSGKRADGNRDKGSDDDAEEEHYHLPYLKNIGYVVRQPADDSKAVSFQIPQNTPITAIRSGKVLGTSGPTPSPDEDLIFGRKLPRNAMLIQHRDSTFALYQNIATNLDTGTVVQARSVIGQTYKTGALQVHVKKLESDHDWSFSTKRYPDGMDLRTGEAYLRADSDVSHPTNTIERTYTADAGNFAKSTFRPGETIRLHSRFAFPIRAKVEYGINRSDSKKTDRHRARVDPGRKAARYDLRLADPPPGSQWMSILYFDNQPMDSVTFAIESGM
ncbi:TPA: hypothetical protein DCE37_01430 [Candidatus Latescibacteria bacterium]|nr:hypothetical protein [Candidatus Latescibacterota bacterium]